MSKARVVVLEVVSGNLTVSAAARTYGLSQQHVYRLLKRYRDGGLDAVDPRSRRPASNPLAVHGLWSTAPTPRCCLGSTTTPATY
ncbi:helix-turn-helix domain-containing protein [Mycobacterium sp. NPDC048908]|uniref:helix-turn-helix domain-containing protein n=1 Tax=Mycobacterium sp. NPDC048908 TaxID=3364292 RepID=UPI00371A1C56